MSYLENGTLRIWMVINPPSAPIHRHVRSPEHAIARIKGFAEQQLTDPKIVANAFGLEVFENGEWSEWYSEDGMDIGEYEEFLEGEQA